MSPYMLSNKDQQPFDLDPLDFDVTENGFLPSDQPLSCLTNPYYSTWEDVADRLPELVKTRQIRKEIDQLPVLSTAKLHETQEWRRAYVLLAFMTHAYIWGNGQPAEILPPALAVPFTEVSSHLELPPVATYSALCLWNYQSDVQGFEDSDSLHMMHNITGTDDESWFYLISVMVEGQGAHSIPLMMDAMRAAATDDYLTVVAALRELKHIIEELGELLERMYERCAPSVFYHEIRPVLAGSKNMAAAGLPKGVFFDLGNGEGEWTQYRGGSNAQSSLIQFFDAVLGVVHKSTGEIAANNGSREVPFHEEMRQYMPGQHRRFLEVITKTANIRDKALACSSHPLQTELSQAYQATIKALSDFRGIHMQIVARYIIIPSRQAAVPGRMNLAVASQADRAKGQSLTGTGGTDLIPFLKQTREETDRASRR